MTQTERGFPVIDDDPTAPAALKDTKTPVSKQGRNLLMKEVIHAYLGSCPATSSPSIGEQKRLFDKYVIPRFGDQWRAAISKEDWLEAIEMAALYRIHEGQALLKVSKKLLAWTRRQKMLKRNVLADVTAKSLGIHDQWHLDATFLQVKDLCAIYQAAQQMAKPFGAIVALAIFTGESIAHACQIRDDVIDWNENRWYVEWSSVPRGQEPVPVRSTLLSSEAVKVLAPYRNSNGPYFQPVGPALIPKLRDDSAVGGGWPWGDREIRRAVRREIRHLSESPDPLAAWSKQFAEALQGNRALPPAPSFAGGTRSAG